MQVSQIKNKVGRVRILAVDDEDSMLNLYQEALQLYTKDNRGEPDFDLILRRQGDEAVETVKEAIRSEAPFSVVFLDLRLPPGPDGLWAAEKIRELDPYVNIVIVTGWFDIDPSEIASRVPPEDRLLYVRKPFSIHELRQFALSLGSKWQSEMLLRKVNEQLEIRIKQRTADLERVNEQLERKIFERKQAEEALQQARDELEVRVSERTAELVRTNEELQNEITERKEAQSELSESEAQIRALNEKILNMLVVVSHDIRSPLISMGATLKLLLRGLYGKMDESVKNTMNDLHSRVNKLLGNTEDCLGKTSVVVGGIDFERKVLDLRGDIIDPVLDELSPEIAEKEMVIDNRLGAIPAHRVPINADRVWLKVVFRNLFSNAIKYGGKGGTVAFGFEDHGSYYKLNVFNSGEPIPEDFRDKLFSKFSRMEKEGEVIVKGMGLGLYLVKEIVRKHGGDIWYEAKGSGSNFVFTLPCD